MTQVQFLAFAAFTVSLVTPLAEVRSGSGVAVGGEGRSRRYALNLTFAHDPGTGHYNGVVGKASHAWNFIKPGTREVSGVKRADGTTDDVVIELSDNDGGWGIEGLTGVYHGYIYHNCRCVDLTVRMKYLPAGTYDVIVFAHGDAPDQNAAVDIQSAGTTYTGRSTMNDGSWDFRTAQFVESNQYVRYRVEVVAGEPLSIVSRRDGSSYAMLNAIQIKRVK